MRKPTNLIHLLEDLSTEITDTSVVSTEQTEMRVTIGTAELTLKQADVDFLLHSKNTVDRFFEALGQPVNSGVVLKRVTVDEDVFDALLRVFDAVDTED